MEQMTSICDMVGQYMQKKEEEKRIAKDQAAKDRYWKIPICYDDDDDEESSIPLKDIISSGLPSCVVVTPVLLIEEPVNSLIMEDEHLDTIPTTESDEVIKSSVENLVQIPSESEGIPDSVCDVPLCNNPTPLEAFKEHSEIVVDFNDDSTSSDDDSPYGEDIDYVDALPPDAEIINLVVVEIVIPEVGGVDTDILLTIKDDIIRKKLLNVNLLIANIKALKDNPTSSSDFVTKSSSTSLNLFLEETNTFDNSLPETKTFRFNLEEISSGSPITRSDLSFLDYEAFYLDDDHIEEKSSGSTTTHADFSQYDSFIFDLSINPFPLADRSDFYHEEFADEHAHIISPPEYECFYFKSEPNPGELTSIVDSGIRENILSTTNVNLPFEDDQSPLLAYVVWIFLAFLTSEDDDNSTSRPEFESFHVDYPDSGDSTIDVVEDIPVDVPNILPTHPALLMDFDFIPSNNDVGSDLDDSSPSGDRNKIYDPGICIEVESTRFLSTLSPVIDTLLSFSSENKDKVFNHGVLASKEKSSSSLSLRGFKASKLFHQKSPMLIHGDNTPNLGVRLSPFSIPFASYKYRGLGQAK
ncbi:hypothetical protein Tco_1317567 [Tanacetum coccineum]